ncbi:hypothetical protein JB92DRAFT_2847751 [Gautieria morchelliformis]|nr:hypothetical protein JB92DRAFT_2847751 [Gautieria morchelliformis]
MHCLGIAIIISCFTLENIVSASGIDPFPVPFSSSFLEPTPPLIPNEFKANYMQLKYDATGINHPVAGFAYYSPSQKKIRFDGSDADGLVSSLFDFGNVSAPGQISNRQLVFTGGVKQSQSSCFSDFVVPGEMLFAQDVLNSTQAVFIGIQLDSLYGPLNAWQLQLPNLTSVLVTLYLDGNNTLVRQDFSAPGQSARTFVTTRFFNIVQGPIDPVAFETDCA